MQCAPTGRFLRTSCALDVLRPEFNVRTSWPCFGRYDESATLCLLPRIYDIGLRLVFHTLPQDFGNPPAALVEENPVLDGVECPSIKTRPQ